MTTSPKSPGAVKKKSTYPGSLVDLHRYRKSIHGPHDGLDSGTSRIVMVRKTDQRTFASIRNGKEPTFETVTRETVETFTGQRTACKITTERKDREEKVPADLEPLVNERRSLRGPSSRSRNKFSDFQNECLEAHNAARKKHGVPPLKLSKEMCKSCQDHASFLARKNIVQHSNNRKYGESVYCVQSSNVNAVDVIRGNEPVECWYEEVKKHDFGREPKMLASGQFTQVVWKETRELGVATAKCGGRVVVVAHYYPPGNIMGCFIENVPPPLFPANELNNNDNHAIINVAVGGAAKSPPVAFIEVFLEAHNKYRALHGVRPLSLDAHLCKFSEEWAKQCAERGTMEHRKNNPYGENIFCVGLHSIDLSVITGSTPVDTWYAENDKHVYGREPTNLKTGHFTQIIWKTTRKLGVGVAKRNGYLYVVANYSPAGNFVGHFSENVLPVGSIPSPEDEDCTLDDDVPEFSQLEIDVLKVHNEYRKKHGVPALKLNKKLCDLAKEWALHCTTSGLLHRPKNDYGENLFKVFSSDYSYEPNAKEIVGSWYAQKQKHAFGVECVNLNTLHFTQVVWKESLELGVGMAKSNRGETFVVANYSPKGNIAGQFNANVLKPRI